jgi:hypothetical protein
MSKQRAQASHGIISLATISAQGARSVSSHLKQQICRRILAAHVAPELCESITLE